MIDWLINLPRNAKRAISLSADLFLIPLTIWVSFCLRLDELYVPDSRVATVIGLTTCLTLTLFIKLGLYRAVIRFVGTQILSTVFLGVSISVLALAFLSFLFQASVPRSVPLIYFGLGMIAIGGSRLFMRSVLTTAQRVGATPVIVYGAGAAGLQLATALAQGVEYRPVAFVDDDKKKQGSVLLGLRVYKPQRIPRLVTSTGATTVLLAISSATRRQRSRVVEYLSTLEVRVQTIPGMVDLVDGKARIEEIRNVEVEDLLGRDPVPPNEALLDKCIRGKVVMVTGAGGSIGSELCRQVAAREPRLLVMYELSEFGLYSIDQELSRTHSTTPIIPILGDVQDRKTLAEVMRSFGVQTVYHAAAYKHVPLVEYNLITGLNNNLHGTRHAALAAREAGVENFILISTDKAVRPTNFMGATKRLAELVLQDLSQDEQSPTRFSMVRFGNVLGSSGSVVPLFKNQILAGGPVTVTHPDVTRYFMTIPEAVQLVIQASAMSHGGEVFVLDMGEPVRIARLAESMIRLMGHSVRDETDPEGDIEIAYTGLRPGEKLYEELLLGNNCVGTDHPMITRAMEDLVPGATLTSLLEKMDRACATFDHAALVEAVKECVHEYTPPAQIFDHLYARQTPPNVVSLPRPGAIRGKAGD